MNIIFVSPEYYIPARSSGGGLGVYIRNTAAILCARGHQTTVVFLSDRSKRWNDGSVDIYEIPCSRILQLHWAPKIENILFGCLSLLYDRWKIRNLVLQLHALRRFDVIQIASYGFTGIFIPRKIAFTVCRLSSITRLLTIIYGRQRHIFDKICEWLEKKQVRRADAVFAPSRHIASLAKLEFGIDAVVIPTTPSDISPKVVDCSFYRANLAGKRYLLYFGQMSRIKGTDILGDSLSDIFKAIPDVHMVFIGRDDGLPCGLRCEAYVFSTLSPDLHSRVHFFPPLPHADLIPCIRHCQAVLMPSRIDNLPNACIESLACGVPVIASNASSIEELVQDSVTGFLFENGNSAALRDAVIKYLSLSPKRRRLMRSYTIEWFNNYKIKNNISLLEKFYENMLLHGYETQNKI
jgi:glycosyltransferase involved in cell wall biosynthesis